MAITVYGIPNCDNVKRARAWLAQHGIEHAFHDFKKSAVPPLRLDVWLRSAGWQALLNRKGTTWRKLDESLRAGVVDGAAVRALMLSQPSVIKRPVVEWPDGAVSVGFDAEDWTRRIAS